VAIRRGSQVDPGPLVQDGAVLVVGQLPALQHRDERQVRCQLRRRRKKIPAKIPRNQLHDGGPAGAAAPRPPLPPNWSCRCWPPTPSTTSPTASTPHLRDEDVDRAITRVSILRGRGGEITHTPTAIAVTLDPPDQPRVR
jgi:hypothetical protein